MLTLPAAITAHIANAYTAPITQVEITFPDGTVYRVADVGHVYGGKTYYANIAGDIKIENTLQGKFDDAGFDVENIDRKWTDIFNAYTIPEIQTATIAIYQTFVGLTTRIQIYAGKLDIPQGITRKKFAIKSTQILNSVTEQFNRVVYSPTCQWAQLGLFAGGTRCHYDPANSVGVCSTLSAGCDADDTDITVSSGARYFPGEYVRVDTEDMLISSTDGAILTVVRGRHDTTAAAHLSGATVLPISCCGSYAACKARGIPWRWGGYAFVPMRGTYTYGTHVFMWKWSNTTEPWETQYEKSLYGAPWGVVYGTIKASPLVIGFKDTGFVGCYLVSLGHGPISRILEAPTSYPVGDTTPGGGGPYVVCKGQRVNDYTFLRGQDGSDSLNVNVFWDTQGVCGYWDAAFPNGHEVVTYDNGQTLSRMAYLAGAFPSRPDEQEGFPEIFVWVEGRLLQKYLANGTADGVPAYTANPAWVLLDMLLNAEYGAGVPTTAIDFAKFYAAAAKYTTLGYEFNAHLTKKIALVDALKLVANATRSYITYTDGKIGIVHIEPSLTASGITITADDVKFDSWKYWTTSGIDRDANVLEFDIQDELYDYQSVPVQFIDEEHIAALGRRKTLKYDVSGITKIAQAKDVGTFQLNLCKMSRRQDGARQLTVLSKHMAIQPGDIITLDLTDLDGQSATQYLVWSTRRTGNAGDVELDLIKWDTGLFELGGISYDTPTTGVNPLAYPVQVSGLTGTISAAGGLNHCSVSWTWPSASGERPEPVVVYLYTGDAASSADEYELLTPYGIRKPINSWTWDEQPRPYASIRVVAVAQSAFSVPGSPVPRYVGDATHQTALAAALTENEISASVDDASALGATTGDYIFIVGTNTRECAKVFSVSDDTVNLVPDGEVRKTYFGTSLSSHPSGSYVSLATLDDPNCTLTTAIRGDSDVPGAPSGIMASADGLTATVKWTAPATDALGIIRYIVSVGADYTGSPGTYAIPLATTYHVPVSQSVTTFVLQASGTYAIGISAENAWGIGPMGILTEET